MEHRTGQHWVETPEGAFPANSLLAARGACVCDGIVRPVLQLAGPRTTIAYARLIDCHQLRATWPSCTKLYSSCMDPAIYTPVANMRAPNVPPPHLQLQEPSVFGDVGSKCFWTSKPLHGKRWSAPCSMRIFLPPFEAG